MHGIVGQAWCYDRWYVRTHLPLITLHAIIFQATHQRKMMDDWGKPERAPH